MLYVQAITLTCNYHLKQLYTSSKTERFSYKDGCDIHGHISMKVFGRRVGLGIDKRLQIISNIMLFKTVAPLTN